MKFVMDERIKHRLTGLVVIISIAIIFLPAMMKKSNKRFEENISISLKLPKRPALPVVAIPEKNAMFETIKVAHVDIPVLPKTSPANQIAKAEPLSTKPNKGTAVSIAQAALPVLNKPEAKAAIPAQKPAVTAQVVSKFVNKAENKTGYAIQLASFTKQANAESLVAKLRKQGYNASYTKFSGKNGSFYQVLVGKLSQKDDAIHLQKKLMTNLSLNGFIVKSAIG